MGDGSSKNIEAVRPGDKVIATDPVTSRTAIREVTRQIVTEDDKAFNELTLATSAGRETLTATYEHPFWSPSQRRWIEAGALQPGMTLLSRGGATVQVEENRSFVQWRATYNLTVEEIHTFYVLAGVTAVLVHNSVCDPLFEGDGFQHALHNHVDGSPGASIDKTVFSGYMDPDEIGDLIIDTVRNTKGKPNTNDPQTGLPRDGLIHTLEFDYPIGSTQGSSPELLYIVEVIVNPDGSIRTAYPR
jgi:hypothetical protein